MSKFPDDMQVEVRFPQFEGQDREAWPWFPGVITQQVDSNEWQVAVTDESVATREDGGKPAPGTPQEELYYPSCFREASEIRQPQHEREPEAGGLCS